VAVTPARIALLVVAWIVLALVVGLVGWWLASVLTFERPGVLWFLVLVPVAAAAAIGSWVLRQWARTKFGTASNLDGLVVGRSGIFRSVRAVAWSLALFCVIVTLAGPKYGSQTRTLRKRGVDVVVLIDFSKSMLARDVRPDRITRAKAEISRFVAELGGDRVGIVAFAGETIEFPMTTDYAAIDLFLRDLGPYDMPVGGTAIGRGLTAAKRLLERSNQRPPGVDPQEYDERAQVIILFTDGEDTEGDPMAAAQELEEAGIRLYTVGIGSATGEAIPTYADDGTWTGYQRDEAGNPVVTALTREAEQTLERMAELTGGKYFAAGRGAVGVDQVRREMRRMKQVELQAQRVTIEEDRYAIALLFAFLLLVLEGFLPDAWVGRRRRVGQAKEARA
jgi:Ca-activated chloride channel family protein